MEKENEKKYLDYFKDKDDNYIIRRSLCEETDEPYFCNTGTFSSIYLIKKKNMEKDIEDFFEKLANDIEESIMKRYKIKKGSILYEKIVGNFVEEEKFNPLFSKMTKKEILTLQRNSIKVKINLAVEFHIRVEKHLKLKAFKETLLGNTDKNS